MGTTVTCQKAAAAFRSPVGAPMYVLFESTYSKNVRPHTPSWECCYIGRIEGAMKRIFGYAADCEGGMLQTPRGMTSPETYIRSWLRHLAAPAEMPDLAVSLTSGTSYLDTVGPDRLTDVTALLASHGLAEASLTLQAGARTELHLHHDADAVAALCDAGVVSPHRLLQMTWPPSQPACEPGLGYAPATAPRACPSPPALLKVDDNSYLAEGSDGVWHYAGWAYEIVRRHVKEAWRAELAAPGQYRTCIAAFRQAVQGAPAVPAGTQVLVHGVEEMDKRTQRAWTAIRPHYQATPVASGWQMTVTHELAGVLICNLERKHLTWLLPPLATEHAPAAAACPLLL